MIPSDRVLVKGSRRGGQSEPVALAGHDSQIDGIEGFLLSGENPVAPYGRNEQNVSTTGAAMLTRRAIFLPALTAGICGGTPESAENLLGNSGFEMALQSSWEKRTPEDASRKLFRYQKCRINN